LFRHAKPVIEAYQEQIAPCSTSPTSAAAHQTERAALDFQQHLAAGKAGLVTRIDRAIDKDTELHR
jgi:hypothetical protein